MKITKPIYYECHITIEPVYGERLSYFQDLASRYDFRVAKLLMQKDREATEQRSNKDSFCTGHAKDFDDIHDRMHLLKEDLIQAGFQVWRCKIEAIVLDEKYSR